MNDAPPKKRPWFQLHLSTCVVLMVVAGVLLLMNVLLHTDSDTISLSNDWYRSWGWPFTCYYTILDIDGNTLEMEPSYPGWDHANPYLPWVPENLVKNALVALAILAAIAFVCEKIIRRRERTRAATEPAP